MMAALSYLLHGATLALAWFLIFNLAATLVVAILAPRLAARATPASPGFWLALRLSPAALSTVFVAVIFLPSYWRYEPRELVEGFDVTLTTLGCWRSPSSWPARFAACRRGGERRGGRNSGCGRRGR
jgi:hypothetical protein